MSTKLKLLCTFLMVAVGQMFYAQVTGTVVDEEEYGISDVLITVESSGVTALTDLDGNFEIDAKVGDVLALDNAGVVQKVNVSSESLGEITFKRQLEELLVSSSIYLKPVEEIQTGKSIIGGDEIQTMSNSWAPAQSIQGKAAGVQVTGLNGKPGQGASIRIRDTSISGFSDPLYVIDGMYATQSQFNSLNPNNIADIVLLKDGASTALYGARAANGVVLVTTKSGSGPDGKPTFNVTSQFGTTSLADFGFDLMDAREKLKYEQELTGLGLTTRTGNFTDAQRNEFLANNHNWRDDLSRTGILQSYFFSANSGSSGSSNNFSVGYDSNSGVIKELKGFNKITGSFKNDTKFNNWLQIGVSVNGSYTTSDEPRDRNNVQNPIWAMYNYNPYAPLYRYDANGNIIYGEDGIPEYNLNNLGSFSFQILEALQNEEEEQRFFRMIGNTYALININKNFNFKTTFNAGYSRYQREIFYTPSSQLSNILFSGVGQKTDNGSDSFDYTWSNTLGYNKTFNDLHNVSAMAFMEFNHENYYRYNLTGQGFPNNILQVQDLASQPITVGTGRIVTTVFSYGGQVSYNYNKRFFLDGFFRRDGSSRAGRNSRYLNFFGGSFAWDMKKENFLSGVSWVNMLKLRTSYGEVGNLGILSAYGTQTLVGFGTYGGSNNANASSTIGNPDTTWEKNKKYEFGLDFEFVKRRIRGAVSFFGNRREGFIFSDDLSLTSGGYNTLVNAGDVQGSGFETELNFDVVRKNQWLVRLYGNYTYIKQKVKDLNGEDEVDLGLTGHKVGYAPYSYELVRYAGVDPANGQQLYYDIDGNVTNVYRPSDNVYFSDKSARPDAYGGFGAVIGYGNFDVTADFYYSMGNYTMNYIYASKVSFDENNDNMSPEAFNYWKNPGDINVLPKPVAGGIVQTTDQFLQDASYLRFRNLTIGYTFNKDFLSSYVPLNSVRMYVSMQNLYTWTKYKGDPEVGIGSNETSSSTSQNFVPGSFSLYSYPTLKTFLVGFNVDF